MVQSKSVSVWLPALRSGSGSDVFTLRLAEGLAKAGHRPIVQWFDRRFELVPWLLRVVPVPVGVDVVHAGSWQGFAFKRGSLPLVITEHHCSLHPIWRQYHGAVQSLYHRLCVQRWNRLSYQAADAVVAVSHFSSEPLRRHVPERLQIIHNGIDTQLFSPRKRPRSGRFRLLFVGNPSCWKGADLLVPLAKALGQDFEVCCLGGLRSSWPAELDGEGLTFLPRCMPEQMPAVYQSVDAVLALTRFETFGYVAVEAMACGIPVVGFDNAGTSEVCLNNETALLGPLDDLGYLVERVRELASDALLHERIGANGRRHVLELFNIESCVNRYVALYRKLLSANR